MLVNLFILGNKGEINVKGLYWLWVNVFRKIKNILGREKCI